MEISDVIIHDIEWRENTLTLVKDSDPLLRRFGQCDHIILKNGKTIEIWRQQADEIWSVVGGQVNFNLVDTRPESPTYQIEQLISLAGEEPQVLLIPFGVNFKLDCELPSTLIRLTTHQDATHPGDKTPLNLTA